LVLNPEKIRMGFLWVGDGRMRFEHYSFLPNAIGEVFGAQSQD